MRCPELVREGSIYRLLADHGHQLFGDDYFADLYEESVRGRPTIAARVMATVMLLQAFEGLSDAEATDRLSFDLRWQAAAGVDTGYGSFHPTSLVGQRNRLRASARPRRLFEDTKVVAMETGALKTRARVLDSTPSMTPWPPKTPSPSCAPPSASCSPPSIWRPAPSPLRCAPPFCATTSTPLWASLRVTGTTKRRARPWSMRSCATLRPPSPS